MIRKILLLAAVAGCTSPDGKGAKQPSGIPGVEKRDTEIKHEPCDIKSSSAEILDANGDQRPEIIKVMSGGRELCRAVDINLDGTIDVYVYFDENGQMRRRESGFDRNPLPDEISYYEHGQLVRKERETNADRKIDTWDYYQGGRLVREERDSSGDGYVNQWWSFNRPDRPECAIVMTDANSDGRPDGNSQVDLCAEEDAAGAAKAQTSGKAKPGASASASASAASSAAPATPPATSATPTPPAAPTPPTPTPPAPSPAPPKGGP